MKINVHGRSHSTVSVKASIGTRGFILTPKIHAENALLVEILIRVLDCKHLRPSETLVITLHWSRNKIELLGSFLFVLFLFLY